MQIVNVNFINFSGFFKHSVAKLLVADWGDVVALDLAIYSVVIVTEHVMGSADPARRYQFN
jgi:hypothetical protein